LGQAFPFSEVDSYFLKSNPSFGCIADTTFLIAIANKDHDFHDDAQFLFEKLVQYKVPIYATVTTRSEFIDYHRRVIMTETLMDMLAPTSKWKISSFVREILRSQKGWIDNQARTENDPYLTDTRIKKCKQAFLPKTQSGQIGWMALCNEYLYGRLQAAWNEIEEALSINYIDMRSGNSTSLFINELKWENMYTLSEESAMGSSDAMILNLLKSSIFNFVITSDYDLAYGTMLSTKDKTALVPESIFRNHIKKLRF
jgi:predicted nucleic acid-binding protein